MLKPFRSRIQKIVNAQRLREREAKPEKTKTVWVELEMNESFEPEKFVSKSTVKDEKTPDGYRF